MADSNKFAFLFPGQGAQYAGMGRDFAESFSIARETFEEADDVLGRKLSDVVFDGPDTTLTETKNSQPGIFVCSVAILRVIKEQFPKLAAQVCAGLSLGEYTAVHSSGRLSFADALRLVQYRADFMNDACEASQGAMAVVVGMEHDSVEEVVREVNMPNDLWAANFNCPGQVVLSGTPRGIEAGSIAAKAKGARRILPLPVHGAFHSGLMAPAEQRLKAKVEESPIQDSETALVMNVPGTFVKDIGQIRHNLIRQVTSPVYWEKGIRAMEAQDVALYLEIGCGKTLSGMNKKIGVAAPTCSVEKVNDLEKLNEQLQSPFAKEMA